MALRTVAAAVVVVCQAPPAIVCGKKVSRMKTNRGKSVKEVDLGAAATLPNADGNALDVVLKYG
jgi:hypothetical protein